MSQLLELMVWHQERAISQGILMWSFIFFQIEGKIWKYWTLFCGLSTIWCSVLQNHLCCFYLSIYLVRTISTKKDISYISDFSKPISGQRGLFRLTRTVSYAVGMYSLSIMMVPWYWMVAGMGLLGFYLWICWTARYLAYSSRAWNKDFWFGWSFLAQTVSNKNVFKGT